jgi:uncharacterized protein (TIGR02594 family)
MTAAGTIPRRRRAFLPHTIYRHQVNMTSAFRKTENSTRTRLNAYQEISRRAITWALAAGLVPFDILPIIAHASETRHSFDQLTFPPIEALDNPTQFGYEPATEEQKESSASIVRTTPKGPTPIAIAQSFVDRFSNDDPEAISQWPAPASWNPLIVEFFSATSLRANNDMIAWCAAFANWCIERSGRNGSRSASSQSFISKGDFKLTNDPNVGDLVVFTCYDKQTGHNLRLGHVAFVKTRPANGQFKIIGGNQSADGHSSIISVKNYPTEPFEVRRRTGGNYVATMMKINSFVVVI